MLTIENTRTRQAFSRHQTLVKAVIVRNSILKVHPTGSYEIKENGEPVDAEQLAAAEALVAAGRTSA